MESLHKIKKTRKLCYQKSTPSFASKIANKTDMGFLKIGPGFSVAPAPQHCALKLEFGGRFARMAFNYFSRLFQRKIIGSRSGKHIEKRYAIRAGWRRGRDIGTVYVVSAFANEE